MPDFVRGGGGDDHVEDAEAGAAPTEEVGPASSEAKPGQCELSPEAMRGETAGQAEFSLRSEIDEAFAPEPDMMVAHPDDGMPVPANEGSELALAPPFTRETVVCIEDDRLFVEVFHEEREAFEELYGAIDRKLDDWLILRSRYEDDGMVRARRVFEPENVIERWGRRVVSIGEDAAVRRDRYVLVRPRRERCKFYKRQLFANDSQPNPKEPGHKILFANCTMRRSVGGAFLALSNEAVYACDYRSPPDPGSVRRELDEPAERKLRERPHEVHLPLLGIA